MRSKTSFFDKTLLKKNLARFAPLWAGYLLVLLMMLAALAGNGVRNSFAADFIGLFTAMAPINLCAALIVAQAVFGDLYSPRICHTLHALPVRRSGIYGANLITGLLCGLIPTAVMALAAAPLLASTPVENGGWIALYWWLCAGGQYLFFFGTAVLCAMLAGNRLGQAGLYALINLGAMVAYVLADQAFTPLLYGVLTPLSPFTRFSPVCYMLNLYSLIRLDSWEVPISPTESTWAGVYTLGPGWGYVLAVAGIGAALLIIGWLLYRCRDLEKAGDFLAVNGLEPVCLICLSLAVGTLFCSAGREAVVDLSLLFLALGMTVGWFAGKMLLARSAKVFRPRAFRGLALTLLAVAAALGLTKLDVLGIERRVPDEAQIKSALVDSALMEEKNVPAIRTFHAQAVADRWNGDEETSYVTVHLAYHLKNGGVLRREYRVPVDSEAGNSARLLYSSIARLFAGQVSFGRDGETTYYSSWGAGAPTTQDLLALSNTPLSISVGDQYVTDALLTKESVDALLNAIIADSEEGTLANYDVFHPAYPMSNGVSASPHGPLEIVLPPAKESIRLRVSVFQDSAHTLEALEKLGITWNSIREWYEEKYWG